MTTTTPEPLTEEQLQAMPLGACVMDVDGEAYVHVRPDIHRWAGVSGEILFTAEHLAALDVMPLHLSAEELDALPEGSTVTSESGVRWTAGDDGDRCWRVPAVSATYDLYSSDLAWRRCDRRTIVLPEPEPEPAGLTAEQIQALPAGTILIDSDGDKWATLPAHEGVATCLAHRLWRSVTDLVEAYGPIRTAMLTVDEVMAACLTSGGPLRDVLGRRWRPKGLTGSDRWYAMGSLIIDSEALAAIGVPRTPATGVDQ